MIRLFNNRPEDKLPHDQAFESEMAYRALNVEKIEQRDMEKLFARLFSSDDGRKALAYLQVISFHRALGAASSDAELRYLEGQRAMVGTILRLIDRGRA
jgi:hypothetical protein